MIIISIYLNINNLKKIKKNALKISKEKVIMESEKITNKINNN